MPGFPNSPSIGNTYTVGNITWQWDGVAWVIKSGAIVSISLDDLSDVTVSEPTQDEILKYNGNIWTNTTATFENITGATLDGGNF
jgi:hypothetical protein